MCPKEIHLSQLMFWSRFLIGEFEGGRSSWGGHCSSEARWGKSQSETWAPQFVLSSMEKGLSLAYYVNRLEQRGTTTARGTAAASYLVVFGLDRSGPATRFWTILYSVPFVYLSKREMSSSNRPVKILRRIKNRPQSSPIVRVKFHDLNVTLFLPGGHWTRFTRAIVMVDWLHIYSSCASHK